MTSGSTYDVYANGYITENLPKILDCAWDLIKQLTEAIFANLPMIIDVGKQIIDSLGVGLVQALTTRWEKKQEILHKIVDLLVEAYHFAVDAASENIRKMGVALVKALTKIVPMVQKFVKKAKELGIPIISEEEFEKIL